MTRTRTRAVLLLGLGTVLLVLSWTVLPWYRADAPVDGGTSAGDLVDFIRGFKETLTARLAPGSLDFGIAPEWFGGVGQAVSVGCLVLAVAAVLTKATTARVAAVAACGVAAAAVAAAFEAIDLVRIDPRLSALIQTTPPGYGDYISHVGPGFFALVLGFLFLAVGAVSGLTSPTADPTAHDDRDDDAPVDDPGTAQAER